MIYLRCILNLSTYFFIFLSYFNSSFSSCEITVFDCGQGNAIAARFNGQSMVFDAGRTAYASFVKYDDDRSGDSEINKEYNIIENSPDPLRIAYIEPEKFTLAGGPVPGNTAAYKETFKTSFETFVGTQLKAVFISHPDFDHYKLVKELNLQPEIYVLGGKYDLYSKTFKDHIDGKNTLGTATDYITLKTSTDYTKRHRFKKYCKFTGIGSDCVPTVDILSINASGSGKVEDKNTDSMIVKVSHNNRSILITGDAEEETWDAVSASKKPLLKSDILIIPHHGSLTNHSTTEDILGEVQPKVCFISAGFQYGHPTFEVINLLLDYYGTNQYRVFPHYITFFENNVRKAIITNAPIFTTIDNGALSTSLSEPLKVKVARNFSPTPNVSLTDEENGVRLFLSVDTSGEFSNWNALKLLNGNNKPLNDSLFGNDVYKIKDSTNKEQYYYRFGKAYSKMKLFEENEEDDTIQAWDNSINSWIEAHRPNIYIYTLRFLGVKTKI